MNVFASIVLGIGLFGKQFYKEYIDPDANRTTCEIVKAKGYLCEIHEAVTDDGYILELHRIPKGKNESQTNNLRKPVALLVHGLEDSSVTWVINMESQSLGFIAANSGIDVWMGNVRGNNYSSKHISRSLSDKSYWNFTFDEMAKYDLPAMVSYVLNVTNSSYLYYVGHSQGTMMGFIQFSEDPEWAAKKIQAKLYARAELPTAGVSIKDLMNMTNKNMSRVSVIDAHSNAGTSTINFVHFVQLMQSGKFQRLGNDPELYHPNSSVVPTYLYWSKNDEFTQPEDFAILKANLKNLAFEHPQHNYDHADFVYSMTAGKDIHLILVKFIVNDSKINK